MNKGMKIPLYDNREFGKCSNKYCSRNIDEKVLHFANHPCCKWLLHNITWMICNSKLQKQKRLQKKNPTKNKINICLISLNISECSHIYVPSALMFWLLTEKNEEIRHITKNKYKCTLLYLAKQHLKYLQK